MQICHSKEFLKLAFRASALCQSELYTPWHDFPFPKYPLLQVQLWEPLVLMQLAFMSQAWIPSLHSSISGRKGKLT